MRKTSILISIVVSAALLLTACGGEETNTAVPGTDIPATDVPATEEATATSEVPLATETVMPEDETTTPGVPGTGENDASRLSNQMNFDVWNQDGEQIGEVNDMILDLDNTRISYVIVGTGGFLEIGEKDVLVPWNSLEVQTAADNGPAGDQNAFILQVDQELVNNAPDVDISATLPGRGAPANDWDLYIHNYWESGVLPVTAVPDVAVTGLPSMTATVSPDATVIAAADLQGVVLASEVLGSAVNLSPGQGEAVGQGTGQEQATATPGTGTDATATVDPSLPTAGPGVGNFNGTIDDVITDIETGDVLYIVVDAAFDDDERWIPIPLNFFQWDATNEAFLINANPAMVRDAPFFQDGLYPDTTIEGWNSEFDEFWQ